MDKNMEQAIDKILEPLKFEGVRVNTIKESGVELELDLSMDIVNYRGALHGGMTYTLCDICAGMTLLANGKKVSTLQGSMNYIKEGLRGPIRAKSSILHKGRTTAVVNIEVLDGSSQLIANGVFTMFIIGNI